MCRRFVLVTSVNNICFFPINWSQPSGADGTCTQAHTDIHTVTDCCGSSFALSCLLLLLPSCGATVFYAVAHPMKWKDQQTRIIYYQASVAELTTSCLSTLQMPEMLHNDAGDQGFSHCGFFLLQNAGILLGFCIMLLIAIFEHHIQLDLDYWPRPDSAPLPGSTFIHRLLCLSHTHYSHLGCIESVLLQRPSALLQHSPATKQWLFRRN